MLLVALPCLICCSRVCKVNRYAFLLFESIDSPIILPGISRLKKSLAAKKAACGPPYPSGTPKRCEFPNAISAPISFGLFNKHSDNISVAQTAIVYNKKQVNNCL